MIRASIRSILPALFHNYKIKGFDMKLIASTAAAFLVAASTAIAGETPASIQSAIYNPLRAEANRARDESRKPDTKYLSFERTCRLS